VYLDDLDEYDLYAREKLAQATDAIEGGGPIKQRLYRAWIDGLHVVQPQMLSEGWRGEFEQLREAFTWVAPGPEAAEGEWPGSLVATLRAMSDEEAEALAAKIRRLYAGLGGS
jgi:hypothetical protein